MDTEHKGIRELLGRYRPVGASVGLRVRALGRTAKPLRAWPWAAAAAALLATSLGLHTITNRALGRTVASATSDSVGELTAAMGGGDDARRAAQIVVTEQLIREVGSQRDANASLEDLLNASR